MPENQSPQWGNCYYAQIRVPQSDIDRENQVRARNRWWKVMFPATARLKTKRNPLQCTLMMLLKEVREKAIADMKKKLQETCYG